MKVRIFSSSYEEKVEGKINEWLSKNTVKIIHVTQSSSDYTNVISIFYEESDS